MLGRHIIERAQRMVAGEFGVPVSAVRISVDFTTPHGPEPGASDVASAAARYHEIQQAHDDIEQMEREQIERQRGSIK